MTEWQTYLDSHKSHHLADLLDFIRIPSVSALPEYAEDVFRAGQWVAKRLEAAGVENVAVMPTGGHPVVYGDWLHAGADKPTVLIYGHFDVQPADPLELWQSDPFEPMVTDDVIIARGASDDKGGMLTPILAVDAILKTSGDLPVNVKFCFEGQEEIGSPQLADFLEEHKQLFAADMILSADGLIWDADRPMMLQSIKGLCKVEIHVTGPQSDLHSGLHGGVLQNPIEALAQLIATMRHPDGKIAIEGFYDAVVDLSPEERAAMAIAPYDAEAHRQSLGIPEFFGEPGFSNRERNWSRPTLDFNGIYGGFQGEGSKTVIPSQAHAKLTCRLVPDQDPDDILQLIKTHIETHTPPGVTVKVELGEGKAYPYAIPHDHPANRPIREVLTEVFGVEPYEARVGGSIPICTHFFNSTGAYFFNFGWSAADENLHAPNEFVRIRNFERGQRAYGLVLHALANIDFAA